MSNRATKGPCAFYPSGRCRDGATCAYQHVDSCLGLSNESTNIMRVPKYIKESAKYRTIPCRNYPNGTCAYGDSCSYIHDPEAAPPSNSTKAHATSSSSSTNHPDPQRPQNQTPWSRSKSRSDASPSYINAPTSDHIPLRQLSFPGPDPPTSSHPIALMPSSTYDLDTPFADTDNSQSQTMGRNAEGSCADYGPTITHGGDAGVGLFEPQQISSLHPNYNHSRNVRNAAPSPPTLSLSDRAAPPGLSMDEERCDADLAVPGRFDGVQSALETPKTADNMDKYPTFEFEDGGLGDVLGFNDRTGSRDVSTLEDDLEVDLGSATRDTVSRPTKKGKYTSPLKMTSTAITGSKDSTSDPALGSNYKTKRCKYIVTAGACPKGEACTFSHDINSPNLNDQTIASPSSTDTSRANDPHPLFKTRECKFHMVGNCFQGDKCSFKHSAEAKEIALSKLSVLVGDAASSEDGGIDGKHPYYKTRPCKWFLVGKCNRGSGCSYIHDPTHSNASSTKELNRSSPCRYYKGYGTCPFNDTCKFSHTLSPDSSPSAWRAKRPPFEFGPGVVHASFGAKTGEQADLFSSVTSTSTSLSGEKHGSVLSTTIFPGGGIVQSDPAGSDYEDDSDDDDESDEWDDDDEVVFSGESFASALNGRFSSLPVTPPVALNRL